MLPADQYRPGRYPPGQNWPSFGDPYLQRAFKGLSAEANANLVEKHERMRQLHKDRLDKQGFTSIPPPWQPPPDAPRLPALQDGSDFQDALEWPTEHPNPDNMRIVPRPADLPPEEPAPQSAFMNTVGQLADQAAGTVGSGISTALVAKGAELAAAAGYAPAAIATVGTAAASAIAPVAKEAVKAVGRMAYNIGDATIGRTVDFYKNEGRWIMDQVADRWRERTPLETLISIPVLTAQDIITHLLSANQDPVTKDDTELLPLGRNIRDPPPWLAGAPEFKPRNYQPSQSVPALPDSAPQSYGPSKPYSLPSSSSSSPAPQTSSSSSSSRSAPYTVYNNVDEWLENVKNRGAMVEEIYKRPGWGAALGVINSKGYSSDNQSQILRDKLKKMSRKELARILIHLDAQAGHMQNV